MDNGKPFKMSYGGVSFDMELARYAAGAADKISGETLPSGELPKNPRYHRDADSV